MVHQEHIWFGQTLKHDLPCWIHWEWHNIFTWNLVKGGYCWNRTHTPSPSPIREVHRMVAGSEKLEARVRGGTAGARQQPISPHQSWMQWSFGNLRVTGMCMQSNKCVACPYNVHGSQSLILVETSIPWPEPKGLCQVQYFVPCRWTSKVDESSMMTPSVGGNWYQKYLCVRYSKRECVVQCVYHSPRTNPIRALVDISFDVLSTPQLANRTWIYTVKRSSNTRTKHILPVPHTVWAIREVHQMVAGSEKLEAQVRGGTAGARQHPLSPCQSLVQSLLGNLVVTHEHCF